MVVISELDEVLTVFNIRLDGIKLSMNLFKVSPQTTVLILDEMVFTLPSHILCSFHTLISLLFPYVMTVLSLHVMQ